MTRALLAPLGLAALVAFPQNAHAGPHAFEADGIRGTVDRDGDVMVTRTVMDVDRPVASVLAALTDYPRVGHWMPDTVEFRVVQSQGLNGRFWRKSKAPLFVPDPYATVDCTVEVTDADHARATWHRLDGTVKVFDALFDLEPAPGGGTRVTYNVRIGVPFPVPNFILYRAGPPAILDTMRGLRAEARRHPATAPSAPAHAGAAPAATGTPSAAPPSAAPAGPTAAQDPPPTTPSRTPAGATQTD